MPDDLLAELSEIPLFRQLPKRHLKRVANLVEVMDAKKGDVLIREGSFSRDFFIVLDGAAQVSVRGRKRDSIGRGEIFGEVALLAKTKRTATVTATTPMRLAVIGAAELQELLEAEPQIALYLLSVLARRIEHMAEQPAASVK